MFLTERSFRYMERAAVELLRFSIASGVEVYKPEITQCICGFMKAATLSEGFLYPADLFEG